MKFYLSSYLLGNQTEKLKEFVANRKIAYIPNARDHSDSEKKKERTEKNVAELEAIGIKVEVIDLLDYFNKKDELRIKLEEFGGIFVSGGNVFVLRQAMKLSGLDEILKDLKNNNQDFLYSGYSAAGCVISPTLKAYAIVDDPNLNPYEQIKETIWDGLGFIDYSFEPHYKSDHPESAAVDKEVEFCIQNNIPYKTVRDGEVIIIE